MSTFEIGALSARIPAARIVAITAMVLAALVCFLPGAEPREWQDDTGGFTRTATFRDLTDADEVVLEFEDGTTKKVPLNRLSAKDRNYVAALMASDGQNPPDPPEEDVSGKRPKKKSEAEPDVELTNAERWEKWGWKLVAAGLALVGIASLVALIDAFRESIGWGIACLIIPPVSLIYIATHWHRDWAARAGMLLILGVALACGAVAALGQTHHVLAMAKKYGEVETEDWLAEFKQGSDADEDAADEDAE